MNHPHEVGPPKALLDALPLVKDYSLAIDGGAYHGEWTTILAAHFIHVIAIEAEQSSYAVLRDNTAPYELVTCLYGALGQWNGHARLVTTPGREFASYAVSDAGGPLLMFSIDDLKLACCGLIKLDLNGGDTLALYGALGTLERYHPVVIVEEKGLGPTRAGTPIDGTDTFLTSLGYQLAFVVRPDSVYVWREYQD